MSELYIYRASMQPATDYRIDLGTGDPMRITNSPFRRAYCRKCGQRHLLKNMSVQVYYDVTYFWCAKGKGCNSTEYAARKRRREFRNRSLGQKRRWAKASPVNRIENFIPEKYDSKTIWQVLE